MKPIEIVGLTFAVIIYCALLLPVIIATKTDNGIVHIACFIPVAIMSFGYTIRFYKWFKSNIK